MKTQYYPLRAIVEPIVKTGEEDKDACWKLTNVLDDALDETKTGNLRIYGNLYEDIDDILIVAFKEFDSDQSACVNVDFAYRDYRGSYSFEDVKPWEYLTIKTDDESVRLSIDRNKMISREELMRGLIK